MAENERFFFLQYFSNYLKNAKISITFFGSTQGNKVCGKVYYDEQCKNVFFFHCLPKETFFCRPRITVYSKFLSKSLEVFLRNFEKSLKKGDTQQ